MLARLIDPESLPRPRVVVRFDLTDGSKPNRYWVVAAQSRAGNEVCAQFPGFDEDAVVRTKATSYGLSRRKAPSLVDPDEVLATEPISGAPSAGGHEHAGPDRDSKPAVLHRAENVFQRHRPGWSAPAQYGYKSIKYLCRIDVRTAEPTELHPYRISNLFFQRHPRARVWLEERHSNLPVWLIRPAYRALITPFNPDLRPRKRWSLGCSGLIGAGLAYRRTGRGRERGGTCHIRVSRGTLVAWMPRWCLVNKGGW